MAPASKIFFTHPLCFILAPSREGGADSDLQLHEQEFIKEFSANE
jgi:hypothetical protein